MSLGSPVDPSRATLGHARNEVKRKFKNSTVIPTFRCGLFTSLPDLLCFSCYLFLEIIDGHGESDAGSEMTCSQLGPVSVGSTLNNVTGNSLGELPS